MLLQVGCHSGLQDAVAFHDTVLRLIDAGSIQHMGHRTDQLMSRVTRQQGVGVERDDVLHPR